MRKAPMFESFYSEVANFSYIFSHWRFPVSRSLKNFFTERYFLATTIDFFISK